MVAPGKLGNTEEGAFPGWGGVRKGITEQGHMPVLWELGTGTWVDLRKKSIPGTGNSVWKGILSIKDGIEVASCEKLPVTFPLYFLYFLFYVISPTYFEVLCCRVHTLPQIECKHHDTRAPGVSSVLCPHAWDTAKMSSQLLGAAAAGLCLLQGQKARKGGHASMPWV